MERELPKGDRLVLCQEWVASGEYYGLPPSSGFSLHVSRDSLEKFVRLRESMRNGRADLYPVGDHFGVDVSDEVHEELVKHLDYKMYYDYELPKA